jgi:hypothetical protein
LRETPTYIYQCVVCRAVIYTDNGYERHCGKLTKLVEGIEGKGVNMDSPRVTIRVNGYIEMSRENLDRVLASYESNPHMGLVYSIHMGYTDASGLEFDLPE